jgi:hypothetical protein
MRSTFVPEQYLVLGVEAAEHLCEYKDRTTHTQDKGTHTHTHGEMKKGGQR